TALSNPRGGPPGREKPWPAGVKNAPEVGTAGTGETSDLQKTSWKTASPRWFPRFPVFRGGGRVFRPRGTPPSRRPPCSTASVFPKTIMLAEQTKQLGSLTLRQRHERLAVARGRAVPGLARHHDRQGGGAKRPDVVPGVRVSHLVAEVAPGDHQGSHGR